MSFQLDFVLRFVRGFAAWYAASESGRALDEALCIAGKNVSYTFIYTDAFCIYTTIILWNPSSSLHISVIPAASKKKTKTQGLALL